VSKNILMEKLEDEQDEQDEQDEITMGDAIHKAELLLKQMSNLIKSTRALITETINLNDFETLNIEELFKKEIIPQNQTKNFSIKLISNLHQPENMTLHKISFIESMNNLIRNAKSHSNPKVQSKGEITFVLKERENNIVIDCTNNGLPIPRELNKTKFIAYGKKGKHSKGHGLGGAYIWKMITAHRGDLEIIHNSSFNAHFRIILPRGNTNE
jgi:sensor histidine kinase regulating citrate/malate metabolism